MANYARGLPFDTSGSAIYGLPAPFPAVATTSSENATTSSVISLSHNTTAVEIAANGGPVVMKWITQGDTQASVISAASGANFDHVIPSNTYRRFVVPREVTMTTFGSVVGINRREGLYQRIAYKSTGVASVMTTEY